MRAAGGRLLRGAALVAAVSLIGAALESRALARVGIQFGVLEAARGSLGLPWEGAAPARSAAPPSTGPARARRAAQTAAWGALVAAAALAGELMAGGRLGLGTLPGVPFVLLGIAVLLGAARDELLLRGVPMAVLGPSAPPVAVGITVAASSVAFATAEASVSASLVVQEGALAVASWALWRRSGGALLPLVFTATHRGLRAVLAAGVGLNAAGGPPPWGGGSLAFGGLGAGLGIVVAAAAVAAAPQLGRVPSRRSGPSR